MFTYIKLDQDNQLTDFNNKSYKFKQTIVNEPLTSLENLKKLVLRLPAEQVYASSSKVSVNENLDTAHKVHKIKCSLEHALDNLEHSDSFIMVRNPETDEKYKEIFTLLKGDLELLASKLGTKITDSTLYLFITSPNGTTPYHIDRYGTYLMQLSGDKDVHTWAPWDKKQITDSELETFMARNHQEPPSLKKGYLENSTISHITPGEGIHIPFLAPHWVKTNDTVSASISIIFNTTETRNKSLSLYFNELIHRKLGLRLNPVIGKKTVSDSIKMFLYRLIMKLSR
jgi:hypothetical protein